VAKPSAGRGRALAGGRGDQVLARVERERIGDGERLVGQGVQFRVVAVQCEDGGPRLTRVVDSL
jgi:hypothetical protein